MITSVVNDEGRPVEIAPGKGDLRRSSLPFAVELRRSAALVDRQVSFARLSASQPMVGAAVNWLLRQSRRVPIRTYRTVEGNSAMRLEPHQHPLAAALANPAPGVASMQLIEQLLGSFLVHGNSVAPVDSGAKGSIQIDFRDWRYAIPRMAWRGSIDGWVIDYDNPDEKRTLPSEEVLYIRGWSAVGPFGVSPLEQLGVTLAIEDAAKRHQRSLLAHGARPPSAILASDAFLGLKPDERKELLDNLSEDVDELWAGPDNNRPVVLPPGLTWESVGHTPVEAQLIEQRVVNRTEAIAIYGLTPAVQGIIERSAQIDEQRQMAVVEGLAPCLILIEELLSAQIAARLLGEPDVYAQFDFTGILRGDKLKEIEAMRAAVGSALMSPNEGRDQLQLERSNDPAMNKFYLPRNNLIPVDVPYQPNGAAVGGEPQTANAEGEGE